MIFGDRRRSRLISGTDLTIAREAYGVSRARLAQLTGIPSARLRHLERELGVIRPGELQRIKSALRQVGAAGRTYVRPDLRRRR